MLPSPSTASFFPPFSLPEHHLLCICYEYVFPVGAIRCFFFKWTSVCAELAHEGSLTRARAHTHLFSMLNLRGVVRSVCYKVSEVSG